MTMYMSHKVNLLCLLNTYGQYMDELWINDLLK